MYGSTVIGSLQQLEIDLEKVISHARNYAPGAVADLLRAKSKIVAEQSKNS